jgi:hypothetical protein
LGRWRLRRLTTTRCGRGRVRRGLSGPISRWATASISRTMAGPTGSPWARSYGADRTHHRGPAQLRYCVCVRHGAGISAAAEAWYLPQRQWRGFVEASAVRRRQYRCSELSLDAHDSETLFAGMSPSIPGTSTAEAPAETSTPPTARPDLEEGLRIWPARSRQGSRQDCCIDRSKRPQPHLCARTNSIRWLFEVRPRAL